MPSTSLSSSTHFTPLHQHYHSIKSNHLPHHPLTSKMKSAIAFLTLACAVSAASLTPRDTLAVCNAKKGESCPQSGQRACENNGGHSVSSPPTHHIWMVCSIEQRLTWREDAVRRHLERQVQLDLRGQLPGFALALRLCRWSLQAQLRCQWFWCTSVSSC
jgi:hypothetical protein